MPPGPLQPTRAEPRPASATGGIVPRRARERGAGLRPGASPPHSWTGSPSPDPTTRPGRSSGIGRSRWRGSHCPASPLIFLANASLILLLTLPAVRVGPGCRLGRSLHSSCRLGGTLCTLAANKETVGISQAGGQMPPGVGHRQPPDQPLWPPVEAAVGLAPLALHRSAFRSPISNLAWSVWMA